MSFMERWVGDKAIITPYESFSLYLRRVIENSEKGQIRKGRRPFPTNIINQVQHQIAQRFESFMFTPFADTVVVSERDRNELMRINPALDITVIPNGVDTYQFRPRPVQRIPALLFVGNYEYAPNVDAALRLATEIFRLCRQRIPQAHLWLVG